MSEKSTGNVCVSHVDASDRKGHKLVIAVVELI